MFLLIRRYCCLMACLALFNVRIILADEETIHASLGSNKSEAAQKVSENKFTKLPGRKETEQETGSTQANESSASQGNREAKFDSASPSAVKKAKTESAPIENSEITTSTSSAFILTLVSQNSPPELNLPDKSKSVDFSVPKADDFPENGTANLDAPNTTKKAQSNSTNASPSNKPSTTNKFASSTDGQETGRHTDGSLANLGGSALNVTTIATVKNDSKTLSISPKSTGQSETTTTNSDNNETTTADNDSNETSTTDNDNSETTTLRNGNNETTTAYNDNSETKKADNGNSETTTKTDNNNSETATTNSDNNETATTNSDNNETTTTDNDSNETSTTDNDNSETTAADNDNNETKTADIGNNETTTKTDNNNNETATTTDNDNTETTDSAHIKTAITTDNFNNDTTTTDNDNSETTTLGNGNTETTTDKNHGKTGNILSTPEAHPLKSSSVVTAVNGTISPKLLSQSSVQNPQSTTSTEVKSVTSTIGMDHQRTSTFTSTAANDQGVNCTDTVNGYCGYWYRLGFCNTTPHYMTTTCAQWCDPNIKCICEDQKSKSICNYEKQKEACQKYFKYMLKNCAETCGLCDTYPKQE